MLIEFTFRNFKSFREQATLSLIAADGLTASEKVTEKNVFPAQPNLNLLRVAAVYGANASGKSNLVQALVAFGHTIVQSADSSFSFAGVPFQLDENSENEPTMFEATILLDRVQYRYGFEVITRENNVEFIGEWLFRADSNEEVCLFSREGEAVFFNEFHELDFILEERRFSRKEALLLSVAAQNPRIHLASKLVAHFRSQFRFVAGIGDESLRWLTERFLSQGLFKEAIDTLMANADTGIESVEYLNEEDIKNALDKSSVPNTFHDEATRALVNNRVLTIRPRRNQKGQLLEPATFGMYREESEGTKKLFAYSGIIFHTLATGAILIVDEMDARFHPLLTRELIRLFQSSETNPNNAQLVFATHDTNLLDGDLFRRDQVWFVEKDRHGASHLYSLADLKVDPNTESYEQDYFSGRYGAIPFLGGLKRLFKAAETVVKNGDASEVAVESVHAGA